MTMMNPRQMRERVAPAHGGHCHEIEKLSSSGER